MTPRLADILERADRGEPADTIAEALGLSLGYVYGVFRKHRPDRKRKQRAKTSAKPAAVLGLASQGIAPPRIAELLGISRQYVYKTLAESADSSH